MKAKESRREEGTLFLNLLGLRSWVLIIWFDRYQAYLSAIFMSCDHGYSINPYLLNAGLITLLQFLKAQRLIINAEFHFVSNLIRGCVKMQQDWQLLILSTMSLVTLVGTINTYVGGQGLCHYLASKAITMLALSVPTDREALLDKVQVASGRAGSKKPLAHLYQSVFIMKTSWK